MKLRPVMREGQVYGWSFACPGCDHVHVFYVQGRVVWSFNGDADRPTFAPSLLNTCPDHPDPKQRRCHLTLTEGQLTFHPDCAHELAGRVVPLPDAAPQA